MTAQIYFKLRNIVIGTLLSLMVTQTYAQSTETVSASDVPALESAKQAAPGDAAVAYRLGLAYLKAGDTASAVHEWQRYVSLDSSSAASKTVRQHLTLLARDEAKILAADASVQEGNLQNLVADKNSIAIMPFRGVGSKDSAKLGKGLQAMVISDLAKVPSLKVVERNKLQALLNETKLGASGLAGPDAVKAGHILRAENMMGGSLVSQGKNDMVVSTSVVKTSTRKEVSQQDLNIDSKNFFKLQKSLVLKVLADLEVTDVPLSVGEPQTTNFDAFVAFSNGLDLLDNNKFEEAREQFQLATNLDPGFGLAHEAFLSVPVTGMNASQISASGDLLATEQKPDTPALQLTSTIATVAQTATPAAQTELSGGQLTYASTSNVTGADVVSTVDIYNENGRKMTIGLNAAGGVTAYFMSGTNVNTGNTGSASITTNAVTDVFSDGVLFMGRWAGGGTVIAIGDSVQGGYKTESRIMPGFGVPYIIGIPVNPPTSGTATYSFYHGTPSIQYDPNNQKTLGSTVVGTGITGGTITANFGANTWSTAFSVSHNGVYNVTGSGVIVMNANINRYMLNTFIGGVTGPLCSACTVDVGGFFAGTPGSPEQIGLNYGISNMTNGNSMIGMGGFKL